MEYRISITLVWLLVFSFHSSYGCEMGPVGSLWLPRTYSINDTFLGDIFTDETRSIASINSIVVTTSLNGGPYFGASLVDSQFTFFTVDSNFENYEEYETETILNFNLNFNCVGGTTRAMTITINIQDTNNNDPEFIPDDEFKFTVIPPLPPGFLITNCFGEITVRDIDLTTQRIDFDIIDSSLFEIEYDAESSTVPKEFKASIRTTALIRNIPEPIVFTISATDVDLTGDQPRTTYATVTIISDGEFELPEEPVFTQTFYLATYTEDHQITLQETISLQQGYTEDVQFSLDQGSTQNFAIERNGSAISLVVATPLSAEVFAQRQILLVIIAELENTSGASATIVVELPEEDELKFEQSTYEGAIVDNVLDVPQLVLSQGYGNDPVSVEILSDHAGFFASILQQNTITLTMSPLDENIIEENSFLNLQVLASTNRNTASTVVTLEIVKNDTVTPVFERAVYEGEYDSMDGLTLEPIILVQGYDATVEITLQGEHASYFQLVQEGPSISLTVSSLPSDLFREQNLLLYLSATKPRTVGATTAISIMLPPEPQLEFAQQYYRGVIEDNVLRLPSLILTDGYDNEDVSVTILSSNGINEYFTATIQENSITVTMSPLDEEIIEQNTFLNLEVVAATNRSSASTIVTLEIIKEDTVTPVFQRAIYAGAYDALDGLTLDEIELVQGYDESVLFSLQGEHSGYFEIVRVGPRINLTASSLPTELFREQNLLLSIEATKPRTVGASAAISIALPAEIQLEFEDPSYTGVIKDNILQLSELKLSQGYDTEPVSVNIDSDYASYFTAVIDQNIITLSMSPLESNIIEENTFLNLQVIASTNRSSAMTIVTLEIVKNDTLTPVFERPLYEGVYDLSEGLVLEEIVLVQGYDDTVEVFLRGEHSSFFQFVQAGPSINLTTSGLPDNLLSENNLLLYIEVTKPRTVGANTAVSISMPEARDIRFAYEFYYGTLRRDEVWIQTIQLSVGYEESVTFSLSGEYASYFNVSSVQNQIMVYLREPIPDSSIEENNFLLLTLSASALNAVTATTTIGIDVVKEDLTTPVFSQNIYYGIYAGPSNINFDTISLVQGFDDSVALRLVGEHSKYFNLSVAENGVVTLELHDAIPEEVIFDEKVLLFSILAEKEFTVGANAVVSISFPSELTEPTVLRFAKNIYTGSLQQNDLSLEDIVLETGYATGTQFELTGEFSEYFTMESDGNILTLSPTNYLPVEVFSRKFISLEVEARRTRAFTVFTAIIIDVEQPEAVVPPVFAEAYYRGVYTQETGLEFENSIQLAQGFDNTVTFTLEGESSQWFAIVQDNNTLDIAINNNIPAEVVEANHNLLFSIVARKEGATDGRAAISIDLPKEVETPTVIRFSQNNYVGQIRNGSLELPPVTLVEGYDIAPQLNLSGEYAPYFTLTRDFNTVTVELAVDLPTQTIAESAFIVLTIEASYPEAISGHTTIVLELVKEIYTEIVTPVFEQAYYVGQYSEEQGFLFEDTIQLIQGFDESVSFNLDGDSAQWFTLVPGSDNTYSLALSSPIPAAVVANNQKLIFVVTAQRSGGVAARATIVIALTDEITTDQVLGFDRISYVGSIANNSVSLSPIVLSEGFTNEVAFTLHGELAEYFTLSNQGATVTLALKDSLPEESIPSNRIILLEIQASAQQAMSAFTTIVLEVILADDTAPPPTALVFDATYYVGSYTESDGLVFSTPIALAEGFDADVEFDLEGDSAQWFTLVPGSDNTYSLALSSPIPAAVVANNQKLIFVVTAQRSGGIAARATIVIALTDEITTDQVLGFDRISYVGSIANNSVSLSPIVLSEGFTNEVAFTLHGELAEYFTLSNQGATVTLALKDSLPEESIPSNRIILLEIQASAQQAMSAFTTIVLEVILADDTAPPPTALVFDATYYVGSYTESDGLVFSTPIALAEGFEVDVEFGLEGDSAQWFTLVPGSDNTYSLALSSPIPAAVVANNQKLIFVVTAQRSGGVAARATVVIALTDEITTDQVLGFDRISYVGSIANNSVSLSPIVLSEGFTNEVAFTLHGELAEYFTLSNQGATVTLALKDSLPEESIPSNRIILLEIQASAQQAMSAFTTIVLEVILADDTAPPPTALVFDATYYVGSYTESDGLVFSTPIALAEGFDADVEFDLEGDSAQWFTLVPGSDNTYSLALSSPIPAAVVANNQKLIFVVTAQRSGGIAARATIVIALTDEITTDQVLGFDRISYVGSIANNSVSLSPIVLSEGFTNEVAFTLHGELAEYFTLSNQGATVTLALKDSLPEESIPSNRIILLEIQASAQQAMSAFTTIVLEVILADDTAPPPTALVFDATYYVGSYTESDGLVFSTPIALAEGFEVDVEFGLEGDSAQWFTLVPGSDNTYSLALSSPIPAAVVANNQKLIFVVTAQRSGGVAARATVVIALTDEITTDQVLGFDRISYVGSIANNSVSLSPIVLSEGFTNEVAFTLHGELAEYFTLSNQGATVTLALKDSLPEESIPSNRIILLEIQASAQQAMSAFTTIVLEVILADDTAPPPTALVFDATYYVGSYTESDGLVFSTPIALAEGFDADVEFDLEGDSAQWFTLVPGSDNTYSLALSSPIPAAVVANNQKLIFVVTAQRSGGIAARATIVIALTDEITTDQVLGFDRISYVGSIANNSVSLSPIVLSEGFTNEVAFTLHGELAEYFTLSNQGATVTLALKDSLPEESIPSNRIILLEIQASAQQAMSAFTTIVLEVILADDTAPPPTALVFDATYYVGSYTESDGLVFSTPIALAEGFEVDVEFGLEGDSAQWFTLVPGSDNTYSLALSSPIPAAVVANNQKLIFVVTAQRSGGVAARATVVIALTDEITTDQVLGFDRISYVGSIANNSVSLSPIVLSEGFTNEVAFTLHGELAEYFTLSNQGATITLALKDSLPEESIPSNRIILLEIQASAQQAMSAFTTIVLEVILADDTAPPPTALVFDATYYVGSYTESDGLVFSTPIALAEGFEVDVEFGLEGDSAQWFTLVPGSDNTYSLALSSPIPAAVVANNQKLIFVVTAQRSGGIAARATIVIALTDEITTDQVLGFDRISYVGSIANNSVSLSPIVLSEGFTNEVAFTLHGELAEYFTLSNQGATVTLALKDSLPEESIPSNRIILLEIQASAQQAMSAFTTIVLEVILADDTAPPPTALVFDATYYVGSYTESDGLVFSTPIALAEGFEVDVEFGLEGDSAQWFTLVPGSDNTYSLALSSPIPAAVVANNQKLIFVVTAQRSGGVAARATVVIALTDEITTDQVLGFDRISYVGSIANNSVSLSPIVLSEGFTNEVAFTLHGELAEYFTLSNQGATVTLALKDSLPEESIPSNRIILLEIQASAQQAMSAFTTIVLEVILADDTAPPPTALVFDATYYVGSYTESDGLVFSTPIALAEGFEVDVEFGLEGDSAQWFTLVPGSDNTYSLALSSPIPAAVVANNQKLIFVVTAQRSGGVAARATVVIALTDEITTDQVLGFDRISYVGSIANNSVSLSPIVLSEGFTNEVAFTLHGELAEYFTLSNQGATITLALKDSLPEESIPSNRIILLEIQASAQQAMSAFTTIVLEVILADDTAPPPTALVFDATYYVGSYTESDGLVFSTAIALAEGFDADVEFDLEGDSAQWFTLVPGSDNTYSLALSSPIPAAVVANNQKLIFVVTAQRSGGIAARATIVIALTDEITTDQVLGFDRISYVGSIANNSVSLSPIVLSEGFTNEVAFTLHGELAEYFTLSNQGATVTLALKDSLPEESIPSNRIILLEIQASAQQAMSAFTTIVLEVILADDTAPPPTALVFDATYYVGSYTESDGLVFSTPIALAEGFDADVEFDLEGDSAQWFTLVPGSDNTYSLALSSPIPAAVVANNQKLIFVVTAQRSGGIAARATIVIALTDEITTDQVLGFDRISYVGSIANNSVSLSPIVLSEGFTNEVAFTLHGELAEYFTLSNQGATVTLALKDSLPEESIPSNRIILLEIQASAQQAMSAFTTIVLEVILADDTAPPPTALVFDATYYVGSYTESDGLVFSTPIALAEGFEVDVEFGLEGDSAQWFTLVPGSDNTYSLALSSPIPAAVVANNQKLIFVVTAQRSGGVAARATVVIALTDEITTDQVLGFDRISYVGSIANNSVSLSPIVLSEGFTNEVAFTLHGELAEYFTLSNQGATVTLALKDSLPEESIPSNRIILLEIQASAQQAMSAFTTIVLEVILADDTAPPPTALVFDATYYVGSYTESDGLVFSTPIALAEGFEVDVEFGLEGDSAQWFTLVPGSDNTYSLALSSPIPAAVVANNQKLIFVVTAQRSGGVAARATVVIALTDEITTDQVLGFDRISYVGSIANNSVSLSPIVLSEGFTNEVAFTLHGELAEYFTLSNQGATVTLALKDSLPEESIPSNRIILLEIQASAQQAMSAFTTIVLEVILADDTAPPLTALVFDATYYVGSYTESDGLVFSTPIALAEGFDADVEFDLEGDSAQWFTLVPGSDNTYSLALSSPIPAAVVANNQKLIFVVTAQRSGGVAARATVVIALTDEITTDQVLGFDRISYVGSIANNSVSLSPIVLSEGFTNEVAFTLHGELAEYFTLSNQGATVTLALKDSLPEESIPSNRIILLEIQASAQQAMSAFTTIVLEVILADDTAPPPTALVFDATYYVGSYTESDGLVFSTPIALAEGFEVDVEFGLEGDSAQWFTLVPGSDNTYSLALSSPIPAAVVANNQKLIFVVTAQRSGGVAARATVVIALTDEITTDQVLGFDRISYVGSIANNSVSLSPIVLSEGFTNEVAFTLHGELAEYFTLSNQGATVTLALKDSLPEESIPSNRIILLEIQASAQQAMSAFTTIVLEVILADDTAPPPTALVFDATYYVGSYTESDGLVFSTPIALAEGFEVDVEFGLEGDSAQWFTLVPGSDNTYSLALSSPIPAAVVANNQKLIFVVTAQRSGGVAARATVVIALTDEITTDQVLGFDRISYVGSIANNSVSLSPIVLSEGFTNEVAFTLHGELAEYFTLSNQGATVTLALKDSLPEESIPSNRIILLEIQASAQQAMSAFTTIVLEVILADDTAPPPTALVFDATYYVGSYTESDGLVFSTAIALAEGFDADVEFDLEGDSAQWFTLVPGSDNTYSLALSSPIPAAVVANNQKLIFVVTAQRSGGIAARATIVIALTDEITTDQVLGFDRISYVGSIANNSVSLSPIVLSEGFTNEVAFTLHGELAEYFTLSNQGATVTLALKDSLPEESIPSNRIILLEIQASAQQAMSAFTTIVLEVILADDTAPPPTALVFDATYYVGSYTESDGLVFSTPIALAEGFDADVEFDLEGDSAQWFTLVPGSDNTYSLALSSPIPAAVVANNQKLIFVVTAQRSGGIAARATIVIALTDGNPDSSVTFDKVLYEGIVQGSVVQHEEITVHGYSGTSVTIIGAYAPLFEATLSGGSVVVTASGSLTLPSDIQIIVLELRAGDIGAVLILEVTATEEQPLPTVTFESASYVLRVEIGQAGLVGRVLATSDNGEPVSYSLQVDNEHLRSRVSVSSDGELWLSAPAASGVYSFQVIATTEFTQAVGHATVHLSVESVTVCGDDIVVAPLIVIDRDEEVEHRNLVVMNSTEHESCHYTLTNRWPVDQDWLYVDESGLHTHAIDREHPSIAFMALSQIQVELNLVCGGDVTRTKRSLDGRLDWLGPYDYGTNTWVLTDTILYNSRRSIVNLIVNDINDNTPIFDGKENEPIVVGYPVLDLEETILPRSLAELQATDADVGENARLRYWSEDPEIVVSPTTGFVHVRSGAQLEENMMLMVNATDRNGEGLTGSISLKVKLLETKHIAVITARDAFLEDERIILGNLSNAIGYEVRALRSVVTSISEEQEATRKKRDTAATSGVALVIYVYGLLQSEPVSVETLSNDINSATIVTVDIASILSLEDHLEGNEICVITGRDTGLLAATIVLSVLLFLLIVAAVVFYFLVWRKKQNYDQFSDASSIVSQGESPGQPSKPDVVAKPRLNIEELKRSERRLQDMLNAPIEEVTVEPIPTSSKMDTTNPTAKPLQEPLAPIVVIQDKLKDAAEESDEDEFGEIKRPRRKSVVTFNENVEKIIHVDDSDEPDIIANPNYEVYKL